MTKETPQPPQSLISAYKNLLHHSVAAPDITPLPLSTALPARDASRPCALLFSPHPDDECLIGALPLRLKREQNWQIINIAVTLGSDEKRRAERRTELAKACAMLGFGCALPHADGFSGVTPATRDQAQQLWRPMVTRIGEIIAAYKPDAVFFPHADDAHPAHIGTHWLAIDALTAQGSSFTCAVIQTEYWQPHAQPNLMIGIDEACATTLLSALSCHIGENARNPFDARFPAFLIDNVRRGSERVGGKGVAAAAMDFAMLYTMGAWRGGRVVPSALKRILDPFSDSKTLFE